MRQQVTIVLNEREPLKAKIAETVLAKLSEKNITASRVEIDQNIEAQLLELNPKILILDYVLGDYSTGLDIVECFRSQKKARDTEFLFLTDEPSVDVAVNAMRLGARHYLDIDDPFSLTELIREIDKIIKREPFQRKPAQARVLALSDLVAHSPVARSFMETVTTTITKKEPIIVLLGGEGSGKRTIARAMIQAINSTKHLHEVDLAHSVQDAKTLFQMKGLSQTHTLGKDLSLIISHIEADDGELLEELAKLQPLAWPNGAHPDNSSYCIFTTNSEETAQAFARLTDATILHVPSLDESRSDDFPALIQSFVVEAKQILGSKSKALEGDLVAWLTKQDWPGNVRQLRSVVIDALISATSSSLSIQELLEARVSLSNEQFEAKNEQEVDPLDPLLAAKTLERSGFRYRATAAMLGCTVNDLQKALSTPGVL